MDGKVVIGTELDTKNFDEEIRQTEEKLNRLENAYNKAVLKPKAGLKANEQQLKNLRLQIEQTSNKLVTLKKRQEQAHQKAPSNVLDWVKNFGKETEKNIKKVSRWALALIGIRGVVSLISRSLNTLSQYDDQLASDVQYLQFALATTLKPVVEYLVQLAFKLMSYVGYIAKAWFGVSIFANASADAMNKTAKSAKDVKKQLAGFDEMNVLSSDSNDSGASATLPTMDLSQQNIEPPKWLVWIGKHGKEIGSIIAGIATALVLLKAGVGPIMALGIGVAVAGIVYAVASLLDYLKEPTWENFGKIIQGIGVFVIGLGIAFLGLPAIIAGVAVLIVGTVIKYWDKIKEALQKGIDWLKERGEWVRNTLGDQVGEVYDNIVNALQLVLNGFNNVFGGIKMIFDGLITFIKGVFTGNWEQAWEGVKQIFAGIFQSIFGYAQIIFGKIMAIAGSIALVIGQTISDLFKGVVNIAIGAIERILNKPISAINGIIKAGNKIPGVNISYLTPVKLPRLAKGGIINMPGRGVNYGGANIAEQRPEGVIPLSDSQQMSLLGEAIGKYITINANITNTMNGRVISRELRKVQNDSDFAFNK